MLCGPVRRHLLTIGGCLSEPSAIRSVCPLRSCRGKRLGVQRFARESGRVDRRPDNRRIQGLPQLVPVVKILEGRLEAVDDGTYTEYTAGVGDPNLFLRIETQHTSGGINQVHEFVYRLR